MKLFAIFFLIFALNSKVAESASCYYYHQRSINIVGLTCGLEITKEESDDNITNIDNNYSSGNDEVLVVTDYYTHNIKVLPPVFCEKFENLQAIWLDSVGMKEIPENSLINCRNLLYLDIPKNKIKKLPENVFASQSKLDILYLYGNLIEELPPNVFAPLKSLRLLSLNENKLTTLDSASFGVLPKFREFFFKSNELTSFDERIFDNNKALEVMDGSNNPCTQGNFDSQMEGRDQLKDALKKCFDNFDKPETNVKADEQTTEESTTTAENNVEDFESFFKSFATLMTALGQAVNVTDNEATTVIPDELMTTTEIDSNVEQTTANDENNAEGLQMFFQSMAMMMNAFGQAFNETDNQNATLKSDELVTTENAEENLKGINENVDVLTRELNKTIAEVQSLASENQAIKEVNNKLKIDIQKLKKENQELDAAAKALMNSNDELRVDNAKIHENIQSLIDEIKKLSNNEKSKDEKDDIDNIIW